MTTGTLSANVRGLIKAMRPQQWVKNIIIYAALVFDGKLFDPVLFGRVSLVFVIFCMVSSSVYLMNDLVDIEKDRQHPRKRARPLPSGQLSPRLAAIAAIILAVTGVAGAFLLDPRIVPLVEDRMTRLAHPTAVTVEVPKAEGCKECGRP